NEFSVLGELIQGAGSEMGITSVALVDNYGDTIMAIEWGDDVSDWNDGWFRAVFYPENGGQYSRNLWYGQDSYAVAISMWWDPATGQGKVYTKSSDLPYNYLVHAVDNASRVVSSLVIEGLRYGSNSLLEMRVHDINLEADLSRHDPNHPGQEQVYDGTNDGLADSQRLQSAIHAEEMMNEATSCIEAHWTGPWPMLHYLIQELIMEGVFILVDVALDILGSISVESFDVQFLELEQMTEAEGDQLINDVQPFSERLIGTGNPWSYFFGLATISYISARFITTFASPASVYAEYAFWIAISLFMGLTIVGMMALAQAIIDCQVDPLLAALLFVGLVFTALYTVGSAKKAVDDMGGKSEGAAKYFESFKEEYQQGERLQNDGWKGRTHFGFMLVQLIVLVMMVIIATGFIAGWIYSWF
ncbi:MAG: hypothetical protein EAX95_15750, partial [Candidatus Thorarchaeota archaeon]|nr:hypothetical protein [Candidatus Thorarchaeota archaeon]